MNDINTVAFVVLSIMVTFILVIAFIKMTYNGSHPSRASLRDALPLADKHITKIHSKLKNSGYGHDQSPPLETIEETLEYIEENFRVEDVQL